MANKLSDRFFGQKVLTEREYQARLAGKAVQERADSLSQLFPSFGEPGLRTLWTNFLEGLLSFAEEQQLSFAKLSSLVEIGAETFRRSCGQRLSRKESLGYFQELLVRHSLFRPPTSVHVFDLEDIKAINEYWMQTFHRHYELYEEVFIEVVNREVLTVPHLPRERPCAESLRPDSVVKPEEAADLIAKILNG